VGGGGGKEEEILMLVRRHEKMMMREWKINAQDIKGKNERCESVTFWLYGSGSPPLTNESDPAIFVSDLQDFLLITF